MKPKNFPARKAARKGAPPHEIVAARAIRTKKPLIGGSPGRQARHGGKFKR